MDIEVIIQIKDENLYRLDRFLLMRADDQKLYWMGKEVLKFKRSKKPYSKKFCKENYGNYLGLFSEKKLIEHKEIFIKKIPYFYYLAYEDAPLKIRLK